MVADNLEDELLARLRAAEILCDEIEGETLGLSRFVTDRTRKNAALLADDALEPAPEDRVIRKNADLLEFLAQAFLGLDPRRFGRLVESRENLVGLLAHRLIPFAHF